MRSRIVEARSRYASLELHTSRATARRQRAASSGGIVTGSGGGVTGSGGGEAEWLEEGVSGSVTFATGGNGLAAEHEASLQAVKWD